MAQQKLLGNKVLLAGAGVVIVGAAVIFLSRKPAEELTLNTGVESGDEIAVSATANGTITTGTVTIAPSDSAKGESGTGTSEMDYKNGTYSAVGTYTVPSGSETIGVELVLKGGIVTAVFIDQQGINPASITFQQMFTSGISAEVVGKSLDDVNVSKVSGSSLTPAGFNDALQKIKAEAKSS